MLQTRGHLNGETVIWELGNDQFDFGLQEFQDLILALKKEGLFVYLDQNRPALKFRLLDLYQNEIDQDELDPQELEYELETNLRNLALRLRL